MSDAITPIKRPRGRPKGSKTKPRPPETLPPPVKPAAMRPIDAARYIGVSLSMIRKLARDRRIEARRVGTCKLILVASLDRLLGGE
jgi:excisionase family DNA binding protein